MRVVGWLHNCLDTYVRTWYAVASRVHQNRYFPSDTNENTSRYHSNNQIHENQNQSTRLLLLCCPGTQHDGEGCAAGLLLPVCGELL